MPAVTHRPSDARDVLTEDLLRKFDTPGPRYTSYPTADRFAESFGPADAVRVLEARSASAARRAPLSLYVHIPFCESLCYYCACNKIITKHHERAAEYLDALETELALVRRVARHGPAGVAAALRRRLADLPVRRRAHARDDGAAAAPSA